MNGEAEEDRWRGKCANPDFLRLLSILKRVSKKHWFQHEHFTYSGTPGTVAEQSRAHSFSTIQAHTTPGQNHIYCERL